MATSRQPAWPLRWPLKLWTLPLPARVESPAAALLLHCCYVAVTSMWLASVFAEADAVGVPECFLEGVGVSEIDFKKPVKRSSRCCPSPAFAVR
jgi:hypothetical protein